MKGQLKGFPPEVVEKMLEYQVAQGNPRNVAVFEGWVVASKRQFGFAWDDTPEGFLFWKKVIKDENFELFFNKYPKQMNKAETQAAIAALKEMVAQTTEKIEALEAQLKSTDVIIRYPVCGNPELMISGETAAYIYPRVNYSGGQEETPAMSLRENATRHWVDKTGKKVYGNLFWVRK